MKYLVLALTLALSLALLGGTAVAGVPDDLQQISVTIKAGDAQGSGTIVTRKIGDDTVSFIWTAGHVVDNLRVVRKVITADGGTRVVVEFRDAADRPGIPAEGAARRGDEAGRQDHQVQRCRLRRRLGPA